MHLYTFLQFVFTMSPAC